VQGEAEFDSHGIVDIYAHFSTEEMEKDFKDKFKEGSFEAILYKVNKA